MDHDCLEHLRHREHDWEERHGLDCGPYEQCHEEWWECAECGDRFTEREVNQMHAETESPPRKPAAAETDLERKLVISLDIMRRLRFAEAQARALEELLELVLRLPLSDADLRRVATWARRHSIALDRARAARK